MVTPRYGPRAGEGQGAHAGGVAPGPATQGDPKEGRSSKVQRLPVGIPSKQLRAGLDAVHRKSPRFHAEEPKSQFS